MSLFVLYLGTRYNVYGFNVLRDITICLFYVTFDLHLWPSAFVKITCPFVIKCIWCCWMYQKWSLKIQSNLKYGQLYWENLHDVTMLSSHIWFLWNSYTNLHRAYQSGILNFRLIKHVRAEIYSRKVNRELWRKMDFELLWPWPLTQGHHFQ